MVSEQVTNFLHLAEALHQASSIDPISPSSLIVWLRDQIEDTQAKEEYQLRLESESTAIQILTVHKSKGLEYPVVFCPFLCLSPGQRDDSFFYHNQQGSLVVDLKKRASQSAVAQGLLEEDQEDARVLYVALTRASSRCVLYHAPVTINENKEAGELKIPALTRILRRPVLVWRKGIIRRRMEKKLHSLKFVHGLSSDNQMNLSVFQLLMPTDLLLWLIGKRTETLKTELNGRVWPVDRKIPNGILLRSFSGLVQGIDFEGKDLDAVGGEIEEISQVQSSPSE